MSLSAGSLTIGGSWQPSRRNLTFVLAQATVLIGCWWRKAVIRQTIWGSLTFDARLFRQRCPKLDVSGKAFGEFPRCCPLRFETDFGETLADGGFSQNLSSYLQGQEVNVERTWRRRARQGSSHRELLVIVEFRIAQRHRDLGHVIVFTFTEPTKVLRTGRNSCGMVRL